MRRLSLTAAPVNSDYGACALHELWLECVCCKGVSLPRIRASNHRRSCLVRTQRGVRSRLRRSVCACVLCYGMQHIFMPVRDMPQLPFQTSEFTDLEAAFTSLLLSRPSALVTALVLLLLPLLATSAVLVEVEAGCCSCCCCSRGTGDRKGSQPRACCGHDHERRGGPCASHVGAHTRGSDWWLKVRRNTTLSM